FREVKEDKLIPTKENGYNYGTYWWSQTLSILDVSIKVDVPFGQKIDPKIDYEGLKINVNGNLVFEGEWFKKVIIDEAFWTFEDGIFKYGVFKSDNKNWWEKAFKHEKSLDLQKVTPEDTNVITI
ncbi:MAG: hypothetical protein MHPSP_000696, partial [Paramarteilia canceri]